MSKGTEKFWTHLLTVAAFVALFLGWVGFILYKAGALPTFEGSYAFTVDVDSASLLAPGARVTVAGAEVGKIDKIGRSSDGAGAQLTLRLFDKKVFPLPSDSKLQIRSRSPVGENYVSIDVGKAGTTIADGGTMARADVAPLVDVDEILSVLNGSRKADAQRMLANFGEALTGRGRSLNQTLAGASPTVHYGAQVVDVLHRQRETVASLVDHLGRVTAAVGERGAAIHQIADRGLVAMTAIADRDRALASTLRELPPTLAEIKSATQTVGNVSDKATPVVANLASAVVDLRPAVQALPRSAKSGRAVIARLSAANPTLDKVLRSGTAAMKPLKAALPNLRSTFCQLTPMLRYLLPYKHDLLQFPIHLGSAANPYDATGHLVNLVPLLNEGSVSGAPPQVQNAVKTLLQSGLFLPQKTTNFDPYMKPGQIGKAASTGSEPSGPASIAKSGYTYPHVEADC